MGLFGLGKKAQRDPVCGMSVDAKSTQWTTLHDGTTYAFCSSSCREKFVANPVAYAKRL